MNDNAKKRFLAIFNKIFGRAGEKSKANSDPLGKKVAKEEALSRFKKYVEEFQEMLNLNDCIVVVSNFIPKDMKSKSRIIINDNLAVVYLNEDFDGGEYFKYDKALRSSVLHEMLHLFFHCHGVEFDGVSQEEAVVMELQRFFSGLCSQNKKN